MEFIIVDIMTIVVGAVIAFVALSASIGATDGGPNPAWSWPLFLAGVALAILGGGLLAAKIIALIVRLWP